VLLLELVYFVNAQLNIIIILNKYNCDNNIISTMQVIFYLKNNNGKKHSRNT